MNEVKQIPASHTDLLKGLQRVSLSTIQVDGHPQLALVYCIPENDDLLLVIEGESPAESNVRQNPRVSVLAYDRGNPWHHMEIRGEIVEIGRGDDFLHQQMWKIDNFFVCLRMTPTRIRVEG